MQITINISDKVRTEASARGVPLVDFVESLVAKGLEATRERPPVHEAIERIRALRSMPVPPAR